MKKTVSFLALLLLVLNAAPDMVFAGEADSTQEQEDVPCVQGEIRCGDIGKCQKNCTDNDDEESVLKRRRRNANGGSASDSAQNTASTASTANSMWPSLTECVSTESSGNTVSYPTMTTYSTGSSVYVTDSSGFSPSSDVSIRCTMAPTESYPSTSATSTDFMSASSASMPASYSSMPPSSASMASSYPSMPPSSASMPPSDSPMPPSSASMPSSLASMPPNYSTMPPSSASMPSSYSSMPPSSPSMPPSYSTMPPISASMPSSYSSMPPSLPSMPPSVASMPPSSAAMPANTASISPSPASTAASVGSVSANTVSTMESASAVILITAEIFRKTNEEIKLKVPGTLSALLANNSVENVTKHFRTQFADHLNVTESRIINLQFIQLTETARRRKRAVSQSTFVIVSFEIIPATSSSQETIAALVIRLRNDVLGGNFTLTDTSGNPISVDTTYFSTATVSADEAPEKRRDIVPIIVGTVVGVFCLALIFIIIVVVILKTKKHNKHNSLVSPTPSPSSSGGKPTRSPYDDGTAGPLPEKNSNDMRNQSSVVENETAPGTSTRPGSESQTQDRN
ncbi:signaling mucin HKR1-like isoform X3 [Mizuhopecten yessoensis]|uniref:signaling mucin HKR1-like isoform X2 n=1 Tax=Mizuhopecten yessoensis TaxID=6573 RepID=UPI000B4595BE|nr:signaling mucin HKR1-like isoform X2 [Mizuhopecten yessoensis]XP_021371340.1 signaling mucin HKR1-like isoform X3 [Mizuhopecten yessoensis]